MVGKRLTVFGFAGLLLLWLGITCLPVAAQEKQKDLQRLPADALGFVSIRAGALAHQPAVRKLLQNRKKDVSELYGQIEKRIGVPLTELDRITLLILTAGQPNPVICVSTIENQNQAQLRNQILPNARPRRHLTKVLFVQTESRNRSALLFLNDQHFLIGDEKDLRTYLDRIKDNKKGGLAPALAKSMNKHAVVAALNIPALLEATGGRIPGALPRFAELFKAKVAIATVDVDQHIKGKLHFHFAEKNHAKNGQKSLNKALALLASEIKRLGFQENPKSSLSKFLDLIENALKMTSTEQKGTNVTASMLVAFDAKTMSGALHEFVVKSRSAAKRMASANNLKHLAIAMHGYHDTNKRFPAAAIFDKNGKPLLSWRVLLLPYLDQNALYQEFRLNEPWDSPHNKKLLVKMPKVFSATPDNLRAFTTHYQGVRGKGTVFGGKRGVSLQQITALDGTSNTIVFVEAKKAVPWTKPVDVNFVDGKPLPKLGGVFPGGFHAALCDGSVRSISSTVPPKTLRLLFMWNDGMVIPRGAID